MNRRVLPLLLVLLEGCASGPTALPSGAQSLRRYVLADAPPISPPGSIKKIYLGGFSGLACRGPAAAIAAQASDSKTSLWTVTSRGPVVAQTYAAHFLVPHFQPEVVRLELLRSDVWMRVGERTPLKLVSGQPASGLPNFPERHLGQIFFDGPAADIEGRALEPDPMGVDPSGLAFAGDGGYWLSERYRPSLVHVDVSGTIDERIIPEGTASLGRGAGVERLPAEFARRSRGQGFSGVALEGQKLYAFLESALIARNTGSRRKGIPLVRGRAIRIAEYDTEKKQTTGEYIYLPDEPIGGTRVVGASGLPDGSILVAEQGESSGLATTLKLFRVHITGASTNIIDNEAVRALDIERLSDTELEDHALHAVKKELVFDLGLAGRHFRVGGLCALDERTVAVISDNEFINDDGHASAVVVLRLEGDLF